MKFPVSQKSRVVACVSAALLLFSTASHADTLSFAAVRDSSLPLVEYLSSNYSYTSSQLRTDSLEATVSIPSGSATARTALGVNRIQVENLAAVDDEFLRDNSIGGPFAVSISAWTDRFTITGGSGRGTAQVSSIITGQFGPKPDPSYGGAGNYDLFVGTAAQIASLFARPLEFIVDNELSGAALTLEQVVLAPGKTDPGEPLPPQSNFGGVLTGAVDFTYGESFYLVSVLSGFANDFGVLNALNSANFGISAPIGATLVSDAGFAYASAVPEPEHWAMLLAGLGIVGWAARRRQQPSSGHRLAA